MAKLDPKALERIARDLLKAASQPSASPQYFNKTLEELETKFEATEDVLRATRIGVAVNKLRQLKDPDVVKRANDLVNKWKKDIKTAPPTTDKSGSGASPKVNGSVTDKVAHTTAAPDAAAANRKFKSSVPPEKRTTQTDGVDTKLTNNATRDNSVKLMYDGLAFMSEEAPSKILPFAKDVEAACYALHPGTAAANPSPDYKSKIRSLFQNLKQKANTHLRSSIVDGSLAPETLVRMTSDELKSDQRRAEDQKMQKENEDQAMVAQEQKSISTSFQCSNCKERKVSYTQAQTRSADEPMTTFCECLVCGKHWKFS